MHVEPYQNLSEISTLDNLNEMGYGTHWIVDMQSTIRRIERGI